MSIEILKADYSNPEHAKAILNLLNEYASEPIGGGKQLSDYVKKNLVSELAKLPNAFAVLVFVDGEPAALANCFKNFSTFACKPLVNIHDLMVSKKFRGMQLSIKLLNEIEVMAKSWDCCKLTLEVLSNNEIAKAAYKKHGFSSYELATGAGNAEYWQKWIGKQENE
ncbi:MAG: GNAT family N-acetyltransferase [Gammaproteobacteria bacterium]|nr:GNAT family N-acetyltransferase [Gammaproteobacteria bacterium]MDH5628647.1 GNAT family N-acetyltransferase [Gammaproteobacteria bacterium]